MAYVHCMVVSWLNTVAANLLVFAKARGSRNKQNTPIRDMQCIWWAESYQLNEEANERICTPQIDITSHT